MPAPPADSPDGLNHRQRRFVQEYLIDLNATQAAIRAGYSADTAASIGCENLIKPEIALAVERGRAEQLGRVELTGDMVIAELRKIGFANMQDYMNSTPDGDPFLDFSMITRDQAAALQEVTVEDYVDGRGEDARAVKRVKFKLADKRAALVDLGRHFKLFVERHEHSGPDGAPIQYEDTRDRNLHTIEQLSARLTGPTAGPIAAPAADATDPKPDPGADA